MTNIPSYQPISLFLPWVGMFLKMTIFRTKVVVTHVTKNRIILNLLTASSTGDVSAHFKETKPFEWKTPITATS
jgi:hypothetical protein